MTQKLYAARKFETLEELNLAVVADAEEVRKLPASDKWEVNTGSIFVTGYLTLPELDEFEDLRFVLSKMTLQDGTAFKLASDDPAEKPHDFAYIEYTTKLAGRLNQKITVQVQIREYEEVGWNKVYRYFVPYLAAPTVCLTKEH